MRHAACLTLGVVSFVMTMFATSGSAQTVAVGPYYATPSWDQTLACATLANCPRFVVLANMSSAAVLDRETGLVWERSPSTELVTWRAGQVRCNEFVTIGNRLGWRLPTLQELASLIDPSQNSPALPPGHPFLGVQIADYYFTATADSRNTDNKYIVSFSGDGDLANGQAGNQLELKFVWCVRGGSGENPQ